MTTEKPLTPRRLKARKLAETAIHTIINESGTLEEVANKLPQFADNDYKRQSVYNSLQGKVAQEEIKAIAEQFDIKDLSLRTKKKLLGIINKIDESSPSNPQMTAATLTFKLGGELIEKQEVTETKKIDTESIKNMNTAQKQSLLVELLKLSSAGIDIKSSGGGERALVLPVGNEAESTKIESVTTKTEEQSK